MKSILFKIAGTLLACTVLCLTYAQKNFKPGYIITEDGRKNGFIDFRDWQRNPKTIVFKESQKGTDIIYEPLQIKEFSVSNKNYESAIVSVGKRPAGVESIDYNAELDLRTDTTFLETLYKGKKSLYYYKDKDAREHFFIKQDTGFELLVYKQYLKDEDGKVITLSNNEYIHQLAVYLNDCTFINSMFSGVRYDIKDLSHLFSEYYKNCATNSIEFKRKPEPIIFQKGLIVGISNTSLDFSNTESASLNYLSKANFSSSQNFAGGLFFNFVMPRNQGRWSLANELLFTSYKVTGIYNDNKSEEYHTLNETTFGYSQIRLNDMLRYKFPVSDFFMYINAGITNVYAISETNIRKEEVYRLGTKTFEEAKGLNDTRKYEQGLIFGTGAQLKKYSIDLRYEHGNGMSKISALNSNTNKFYLLLGYRF